MIADAPVAAAAKHSNLLEQVTAFLDAAREASVDGLTWSEFGTLLVWLLRLAITTLDTVSGMSGPEKKAVVIEAVGVLFDQLAGRAVPPIVWPVWVIARPAIRSLVLALAGGAVEVLLPMVRIET